MRQRPSASGIESRAHESARVVKCGARKAPAPVCASTGSASARERSASLTSVSRRMRESATARRVRARRCDTSGLSLDGACASPASMAAWARLSSRAEAPK